MIVQVKKIHCLLMFYTDISVKKDGSFLEPLSEFFIEEKTLLDEIFLIGYERKDMQSLFQIGDLEYLTIDSIYNHKLNNISQDIKKAEKDKKAYLFMKKFINSINQKIPNNYYCFDFSFPSYMINEI